MQRRQRQTVSIVFAAALAGAAVAGCDDQPTPTDPGDPSDTVTSVVGNVVNGRTEPLPAAKIVLVWGEVGAMFPPFGASVDLKGNFPEQFEIDLTNPPAAERLFYPTVTFPTGYFDPTKEVQISVAQIIAVKQEVDPSTFISSTDVVGGAEDWALVYAAGDVAAGTAGAAYLGGPVSAGYHVMSVKTEAQREAVYPAIAECESKATDAAVWKACGIYTSLALAPADSTIAVRLVDDGADLSFRSLGPTFWPANTPIPSPDPNPPCMQVDEMMHCLD